MDPVHVSLLSEVKSCSAGNDFWIGTLFTIDPGWHIYWSNPGDAGMATKVSLKLPQDFTAGDIYWPYPEKFDEENTITFGYREKVLLLNRITPPEKINGDSVKIDAEISWLMCKDICLPGEASLSVSLPVKKETILDETNTVLFDEARTKLPVYKNDWKIKSSRENREIKIYINPPEWFGDQINKLIFFPLEGGIYDYSMVDNFNKEGMNYIITLNLAGFIVDDPDSVNGIIYSDAGWDKNINRNALFLNQPIITITN